MNDKNKQFFSLILVRPGVAKPLHLKISSSILYSGTIFIVFFVLLISLSAYTVFNEKNMDRQDRLLSVQVQKQERDLRIYEHKVNQLSLDVEYILAQEKDLGILLGTEKGGNRRQQQFKKKYQKIKGDLSLKDPSVLKKRVKLLEDTLTQSRKKYANLFEVSNQYKKRFELIPSIWPTHGPILSHFGLRRHPFTKISQFHKGIDIASMNGAPIKTSADGYVEFSGWAKGFGKTIVVNHGFGYRTLYAHCSHLKAQRAQKVKKGEVIAFVGSTGRSTGPHLHYEIRRWQKPLEPKRFLDMDMFTARRQVW